MGYISDFETRLRVILEGYVPEEVLETALTTAKGAVIESYKNGIEHGRLAGEKPRETQRPARRGKPAWKRRR